MTNDEQSYLLKFNLEDEQEARAYEVYKHYAKSRSFKGLIVSFLLAIWTIEEQTHKIIGISEFMGLFLSSIINGGSMLNRPTLTPEGEIPEISTLITGSSQIDPEIGREEHTQGLSTAFLDDEDLWDD